jgi:outer membrane protein OmpA-like peptidoglycan-associated protein
MQDQDCADANVCTFDRCDQLTHTCHNFPIPNCCTSDAMCDDHIVCTADACDLTNDSCTHTPIASCCTVDVQCADGDPCTIDSCDPSSHTCVHTSNGSCCANDADCHDGDACTFDRCNHLTGTCEHEPIPDCCTNDAGCGDGDFCTEDLCLPVLHRCEHSPISDCCHDAGDCDDADHCTTDSCDATTHRCQHAELAGCCQSGADCVDNNPCTEDSCDSSNNTCRNTIIPGCCQHDADCNDGDACTFDHCRQSTHTCAHFPEPNCCHSDADCDDGQLCTRDQCDLASHACMNSPISNCCTTNADCTDASACTFDHCDQGSHTCRHLELPNCCQSTSDCNDGNACTTDACNTSSGTCSNQQIAGCCLSAGDCDDHDACTEDSCSGHACVFTPIPGCCPQGNCAGDAGVADSGVAGSDAGTRDAGVTNGLDVSGGGCACGAGASGSPWSALWIGLAILWPLVRRHGGPRASAPSRRCRGGSRTCACAMAIAVFAWAAGRARAGGFDAELFHPATSTSGYFSQPSARVLKAGELDLGAGFDFANDPLVARDPASGNERMNGGIVANRLSLQLAAGYGLGDRYEVGVAVPLVLAQGGDLSLVAMGRELSTTTLGDVRLFGKAQLWKHNDVMVAAALDLALPTGNVESFTGAPTASAWPRAVLGWQPGRWSGAINVGIVLRGESQLANVKVGDEITTGVGLGYELQPDRLWLLGEGFVARGTSGGAHDTAAEVLAGVRALIHGPWRGQFAIGEGLGRGVSAPAFEAVAAMSYTAEFARRNVAPPIRVEPPPRPPVDVDTDGDGLIDRLDRCPNEPEDKDGFQDEDGCPDPDNDADGVPDATDRCPLEPEDKDGFQDQDGCPDPDNDGDGILDAQDRCINEPETKNGYLDDDGCPDEIPTKVKRFTGVVRGVNFKLGSPDLLPGSQKVLDEAVAVLQEFPDLVLEIQGHTDDQVIGKGGPFKDNDELSQARAETVRAYMTAMGIAPARLVAKGYGAGRPQVDAAGLSGSKLRAARAQNRRVQFEIVVKP